MSQQKVLQGDMKKVVKESWGELLLSMSQSGENRKHVVWKTGEQMMEMALRAIQRQEVTL